MLALSTWLGPRDASPIDPAALQFRAKPAKSCRGCAFERQRSDICNLACHIATLSGAPHCEQGYIYVAVEADPRQLIL